MLNQSIYQSREKSESKSQVPKKPARRTYNSKSRSNSLQNVIGNHGMLDLIQKKGLKISDPHSPAEREARAVAKGSRSLNTAGKESSHSGEQHSEINQIAGPGRHLSVQERVHYESKLQNDLSHVKLHTGEKASNAAESINARAFALGNHVVFQKKDDAAINSTSGILHHELTHIIQQKNGFTSNTIHRAGPAAAAGAGLTAAKAAEWATVGGVGYGITSGILTSASPDVSYSFDEWEGTKLYNNDPSYKTKHKYPKTLDKKTIAIWAGGFDGFRRVGIKFGIRYMHDGYSIGSISLNYIDVYDWVGWGGSVMVNLTALDIDGPATLRITCNVAASSPLMNVAGSAIYHLNADSELTLVDGYGDHIYHEISE